MRLLVLIGFVLALSSCERKPRWLEKESLYPTDKDVYSEETGAVPFSFAPPPAPIATERKLIKTGSVEFEVDNVEKTKTSVVDLVKQFNGYISSDDQNNYSGAPRFSQVARIPSDKLDEFITKIETLAKKVDSKNISTQDVTEEFIDVETRLTTKKELEARYRDILKQAKTVKDILEVETQLNNVRGEIESMEGRLKYLANQTSFSTLTITYYQTISGNYGFGYRFFNTFGDGWDSLLDFIIVVLSLWPFIIMIGILSWLIIRWRRNRRIKNSVS